MKIPAVYTYIIITHIYFFKFKKNSIKKYINLFIFIAEPLPLMDLCRRTIRQKIGRVNLEERIQQLQLPLSMKTYLLYKNRR